MKLGRQIMYHRKRKNITQEELANQLGITNQAVSKWETEQSYPDIELLEKIADIFEISLDELFGRNVEKKEEELNWQNNTLYAVLFKGSQLLRREKLDDKEKNICKNITIEYDGEVENIESYFNVNVCCGDVENNVSAGGYVACCDVGNNVEAGTYIECADVGNDVKAGAWVECCDVGGNVRAGAQVECGDVGGDVRAGAQVECANVGGDVEEKVL